MYYVDPDETIAKLKARIREKTNIPRPCQKLFLKDMFSFEEANKEDSKGIILENDKKLTHYEFGLGVPPTVLLETFVDPRLAMKDVGEMSRAEIARHKCKTTIGELPKTLGRIGETQLRLGNEILHSRGRIETIQGKVSKGKMEGEVAVKEFEGLLLKFHAMDQALLTEKQSEKE